MASPGDGGAVTRARARRTIALATAAWVATASCGAAPGPARRDARTTVAAGTGQPAVAHPAPRLGNLTVTAYELRLAVDPQAGGFSGDIVIHGLMAPQGNALRLNAVGLRITAGELLWGASRTRVAARMVRQTPDQDSITIQFADVAQARDLPPAREHIVTVRLAFAGNYDEDEGIFVRRHRDEAFVFTDLEPEAARQVFPHVDRPDIKVPWTVTLDVPRGLPAFSNMPQLSREALPSAMDRVRFATSPPLPSYLVGVAVGPLQAVPVPAAPVPTRFLLPASYVGYVAPAVAVLPAIMREAQRLVGLPLPYPKHDFVGIPDFSLAGMENPGLITFDAAFLTTTGFGTTPRRTPISEDLAVMLAHEVAHLWFGDLVTLGGWRDLWFQEGFATYLSYRILDAVFPRWHIGLSEIGERRQPAAIDRLEGAPPVRPASVATPILIFTPTTYLKGGAIIETLGAAMGHDVLMATAKAILTARADATLDGDAALATFAAQLPAVFGDASARLAMVHDLFERAGQTEIRIATRCGAQDNAVVITTTKHVVPRYPLCLRIRDDRGFSRTCLALANRAEIPTHGCASVALPANGEGYLALALAPDLRARTLRHAAALTPRERLLLGDMMPPRKLSHFK